MGHLLARLVIVMVLFYSAMSAADSAVIHHQIDLRFDSGSGELQLSDTLTLPESLQQQPLQLALDSQFELSLEGRIVEPASIDQGLAWYSLPAVARLALNYRGKPGSTPGCDWLRDRCFKADSEGLYLGGDSAWYPIHPGTPVTLTLNADLPQGWSGVSQGVVSETAQWQELQPQQTLYYIAAPFHVYREQQNGIDAQVYLLQPEPALAQQYLQATHHYLGYYSDRLGAYPYAKFATVESFWPSGWGMPSFTLLGGQVLRLPFILHTSFPHEILHNWWGNGVFVDARDGNWSEGLTAYLADHAQREQRGDDLDYRREQLQQFAVYVSSGDDFPLAQFRSRHDRSSQAIGYGKAMMLFHEIRRLLGDDAFFAGLQRFYSRYRFTTASFSELLESLLTEPEEQQRFRKMLFQPGAAALSIAGFDYDPASQRVLLELQQSDQPLHSLKVPVLLELANGKSEWRQLNLTQRRAKADWRAASAVCAVHIDPHFDIMRLPLKAELPATLHELFRDQPAGWQFGGEGEPQLLAQMLGFEAGEGGATLWFGALSGLPAAATAYIEAHAGSEFLLALDDRDSIRVASLTVDGKPFVWISTADTSLLPGLLRKLGHYGKYSYLQFDRRLVNRVKGSWLLQSSPLRVQTGACNNLN